MHTKMRKEEHCQRERAARQERDDVAEAWTSLFGSVYHDADSQQVHGTQESHWEQSRLHPQTSEWAY